MESTGWGDMTLLHFIGQGLADQKDQRIRDNHRLKRAGIALDPKLAAEISRAASAHEDAYNKMLVAEYRNAVPKHVRDWVATVPGLASGELFPRIISAIGHPRIATPRYPDPDDPQHSLIVAEAYIRSPLELRQYCGTGDPWKKPFKGMTQEDLFALGKQKIIHPLLFTWTTTLAKAATPAKETGVPRSIKAAESEWWQLFLNTRRKYSGHDGKCHTEEEWPASCAGTHKKHTWLISTPMESGNPVFPMSIPVVDRATACKAAEKLGFPVVVRPFEKDIRPYAENMAQLEAIIPFLREQLCRNKHVYPAKPNGCGIVAHPEWGYVGSFLRPGHIEMNAHRKLHQAFLDKLWEVSGRDGLTPYEPRIRP